MAKMSAIIVESINLIEDSISFYIVVKINWQARQRKSDFVGGIIAYSVIESPGIYSYTMLQVKRWI